MLKYRFFSYNNEQILHQQYQTEQINQTITKYAENFNILSSRANSDGYLSLKLNTHNIINFITET